MFGNIFKQKRRILAQLVGVQKAIEEHPRRSLLDLEERLIRTYNEILAREEIYWFQKSRCTWLEMGDRNTKYFYSTTITKRRHSRITTLKNGSDWFRELEQLKNMVLDFFKSLYQDVEEVADP